MCVYVAVIAGLTGCCALPLRPSLIPERENTRWLLTTRSTAADSVVLVHGLNQRPSTLDGLATTLTNRGLNVLRLSLRGHGTTGRDDVSAQDWLDDLQTAFTTAKTQSPHGKVFIAGYSLGGLLAAHALVFNEQFTPDALVLLAPAISLKTLPNSIRVISWLASSQMKISSVAPTEYRRWDAIPLRWYENLFALHDRLRGAETISDKALSIPVRSYMRRDDELVSYGGVREWIQNQGLTQTWTIEALPNSPEGGRLPAHLIVDQHSLGIIEWKSLTNAIVKFFYDSTASSASSPASTTPS